MQKLMALGLDYFDAQLACKAIKSAQDTEEIAIDQLEQDENFQYYGEDIFICASPIQIMFEALEDSPISKN
jgi:hypothetical protein